FQRMCVVGVQENWLAKLLADTPHQSGYLFDPDESSFPLGNTHKHRKIEFSRGGNDRIESGQIRNIEVAERNALTVDVFERFLQSRDRTHGTPPLIAEARCKER